MELEAQLAIERAQRQLITAAGIAVEMMSDEERKDYAFLVNAVNKLEKARQAASKVTP